ncbi:MAG: hypothetical protein CL607_28290 [Anaerolineaceae bacterium]|nr:hypothetical protein [Anaerolineaceae bacterium]
MQRFSIRFLLTSLFTAMLLLTACGSETPADDAAPTAEMTTDNGADTSDTTADDANSDTPNTSDSAPAVSYTVTGAVEAQGEGTVLMFCDDGDGIMDPFIEIGHIPQLELTVMTGVSGTVEVLGSDETEAQPGSANYVNFRSEDRVNYDLGSGELVIENLPAAEGEMFIGTLTAELSDEDGNTINLEATYNAEAGMQSFEDCQ